MKSDYEKDRERLTPREREEVWGRILQRVGGRRARSFPRIILATAGACAVIALLFLIHPAKMVRIEHMRVGPALTDNKATEPAPPSTPTSSTPQGSETRRNERSRAISSGVGKSRTAAPGGAKSDLATSATPASPSRVVAAPGAPPSASERAPTTTTPPATTPTQGSAQNAPTPNVARITANSEVATGKTAGMSVQPYAKDLKKLPVHGEWDATGLKAPGSTQYATPQAQTWGRIHDLSGSDTGSGPLSAMPAIPDEGRSRGGIAQRAPTPPVYPTTGGSTLPNDQVYDSMYFEHYGVNPFIATDDDPLSTFAVDVDAASYTVARRYIDEGHLPPKEAVRVEEYVNFFRQDYPDFTDSDFRIYLEGAPSPFGKGYELLRIGLKARAISERDRRPATLVFVIDHSGSMARENRLELVKEALHILVDRLNPDDRIGLVTYDTVGQALLEPTSLEDGYGRERILDAIDRLQPGGSTNAAEGLDLGYDMARRNYSQGSINRIILCTDGVANEGMTGAESILAQARHEADRGIELTAIGFGMGNYNDVLLEKLADNGDGNYYYVDRLDEAQRIFIEKLTGTIQTIAKDAKVQVAFDPRRVLRYRLLGFENRDVADRDFRNDKVDAGEIGAGHEVTALYELKLADPEDSGTIATVHLRYARPDGDGDDGPDVREIQRVFDARDLTRSFDRVSPRFRLDAAVAEFAEILRHSFWAKESRISDVLPLARSVAEEIPGDPDVQEFARIVKKAMDLSDKLSPEEQRERESYDMPWSTEKTLKGDGPDGER